MIYFAAVMILTGGFSVLVYRWTEPATADASLNQSSMPSPLGRSRLNNYFSGLQAEALNVDLEISKVDAVKTKLVESKSELVSVLKNREKIEKRLLKLDAIPEKKADIERLVSLAGFVEFNQSDFRRLKMKLRIGAVENQPALVISTSSFGPDGNSDLGPRQLRRIKNLIEKAQVRHPLKTVLFYALKIEKVRENLHAAVLGALHESDGKVELRETSDSSGPTEDSDLIALIDRP